MAVKRKSRNTRKKSRGSSATLAVRARTAEKRRNRLERVKSFALALVAVAGLIWLLLVGGGYLLKRTFTGNDRYIVRNIEIQTDGRLTPALVMQYGGIAEGINLFDLDLGRIRTELENVPIIKQAEVRRSLPDTLEVRLIERIALAKVGGGTQGYQMMVDREGVLLGPVGRDQVLPTLSGLRTTKLRMGRVLQGQLALDALEALDLCDRTRLKQFIQIENIDISDAETMEIRLQTGEYVTLPRRNIRAKLVDLANIINTCRRQKRQIAKIDMTVDNVAPAVEYR